MIDKIKLFEKALSLGSKKTINDLEMILSKYDMPKLIEDKKNKFRLEIWDKKKSINGVTAKNIINSRNYEIDQVYLIYIDNKLVYLQDHNPNESGFVKMTNLDVEEIGNKFIENKATQSVYEDIYNDVIRKMLE